MDKQHLVTEIDPRAVFPPSRSGIAVHALQWRLNLLLFVLTILSTMMVGASMDGQTWEMLLENPANLLYGWQYSFALLVILTAHEMGHYLAARWHGMRVTLPFYIPVPLPAPYFFHFGTMGAFIRIRSRIPDRNALMDVAVAGPIAGFVMAFLFLTYGYLTLPDTTDIDLKIAGIHGMLGIVTTDGPTLMLGSSLLFYFFNDIIGMGAIPMSEIYHFPFIFAGWIGLFITALNLIPLSQLDGGHVLHALFGRRARTLSKIAYGGLLALAATVYLTYSFASFIWIFWSIILLVMGLFHPPTLDDALPITPTRRYLGWSCFVIFLVSFMPVPLYVQM